MNNRSGGKQKNNPMGERDSDDEFEIVTNKKKTAIKQHEDMEVDEEIDQELARAIHESKQMAIAAAQTKQYSQKTITSIHSSTTKRNNQCKSKEGQQRRDSPELSEEEEENMNSKNVKSTFPKKLKSKLDLYPDIDYVSSLNNLDIGKNAKNKASKDENEDDDSYDQRSKHTKKVQSRNMQLQDEERYQMTQGKDYKGKNMVKGYDVEEYSSTSYSNERMLSKVKKQGNPAPKHLSDEDVNQISKQEINRRKNMIKDEKIEENSTVRYLNNQKVKKANQKAIHDKDDQSGEEEEYENRNSPANKMNQRKKPSPHFSDEEEDYDKKDRKPQNNQRGNLQGSAGTRKHTSRRNQDSDDDNEDPYLRNKVNYDNEINPKRNDDNNITSRRPNVDDDNTVYDQIRGYREDTREDYSGYQKPKNKTSNYQQQPQYDDDEYNQNQSRINNQRKPKPASYLDDDNLFGEPESESKNIPRIPISTPKRDDGGNLVYKPYTASSTNTYGNTYKGSFSSSAPRIDPYAKSPYANSYYKSANQNQYTNTSSNQTQMSTPNDVNIDDSEQDSQGLIGTTVALASSYLPTAITSRLGAVTSYFYNSNNNSDDNDQNDKSVNIYRGGQNSTYNNRGGQNQSYGGGNRGGQNQSYGSSNRGGQNQSYGTSNRGGQNQNFGNNNRGGQNSSSGSNNRGGQNQGFGSNFGGGGSPGFNNQNNFGALNVADPTLINFFDGSLYSPDFGYTSNVVPVTYHGQNKKISGEILELMALISDSKKKDETSLYDFYKGLNLKVRILEKGCPEYKTISEYLRNSHGPKDSTRLTIENIYKISRRGEEDRYKSYRLGVGLPKLLWYGTKSQNYADILKRGLTQDNAKNQKGYSFNPLKWQNKDDVGPGIYFHDVSTEAAKACKNSTGLLLLAEIALGKPQYVSSKLDIPVSSQLANGKSSYKILGRYTQDRNDHIYNYNNVQVPIGKPKPAPKPSDFEYNKYIVLDPKQILMQFLVKVKIN